MIKKFLPLLFLFFAVFFGSCKHNPNQSNDSGTIPQGTHGNMPNGTTDTVTNYGTQGRKADSASY